MHEDKGITAINLELENLAKTLGILELASSKSGKLNKVLVVFTYLLTEIKAIKEYIDTIALPTLNFYGEGVKNLEEGDHEVQMGRIMSHLHELFECITYSNSLVINIIH